MITARLLPMAVLVCGLGQSIAAQQPIPSQATPTRQERRVGIDVNKRMPLTMRDAILLALENNRDIEIEKLTVKMNEFDLRAAEGAYDPTLAFGLQYDRSTMPVSSILIGQNGSVLSDTLTGTGTFNLKLPSQGGSVQATIDNGRSTTSNLIYDLSPSFPTSYTLAFTQPLWRNRTIDQTRRQLRIARKRLDISDSEFRQRVIEIISQVQRAYWDLAFARRDEEIKRESVDLAQRQLEHNERLAEGGTLARAEVTSARVEVERRTDEAEEAVETIQRAEGALKALLISPNNASLWNSALEPVEAPTVNPAPLMPLDDALKLALRNRPEMEQYRLRGELNQIDAAYYRNQTKPQIDFFASYGSNGLAGGLRSQANPLTEGFALLNERVSMLSQLVGLPPIPITTNTAVPDFLIGGYGTSLENLFRNDFRVYRVGLNFNLTLRNRTAEAQLGRSLVEGQQIDVQRQQTAQRIELEVRNALQAVETARLRIEAARKSRDDARLQYESELRKFDAGQSTNYFVLDRQNALSSSESRLLRAQTNYTKAVAELDRALSTTLTSNSVEIPK